MVARAVVCRLGLQSHHWIVKREASRWRSPADRDDRRAVTGWPPPQLPGTTFLHRHRMWRDSLGALSTYSLGRPARMKRTVNVTCTPENLLILSLLAGKHRHRHGPRVRRRAALIAHSRCMASGLIYAVCTVSDSVAADRDVARFLRRVLCRRVRLRNDAPGLEAGIAFRDASDCFPSRSFSVDFSAFYLFHSRLHTLCCRVYAPLLFLWLRSFFFLRVNHHSSG